MRFYGDIALPNNAKMILETGIRELSNQVSVCNMEGVLSEVGGYTRYTVDYRFLNCLIG